MLSEKWEAYAQLSRRLPHEKDAPVSEKKRQAYLDRFLQQYLKESATDDSGLLCEMRNVSNELSHEFMRNIFNVTDSTAENEDTICLEKYLLHERGWLLLYTIHKTGVQGIYNRYDLCNILLTLLPFCLKIHRAEIDSALVNLLGTDANIPASGVFQQMENGSKWNKPAAYNLKVVPDYKGLRKNGSSKDRKRYTKTLSSKKKYPEKESEGNDSETKKTKQPRLRKSTRTQVWTPQAREEESVSEDEFAESYEESDTAGSKSVDSHLLFQLLLHLLEDLAVLDINVSDAGQTLSALILPVLLDVLQTFAHASKVEQSAVPINKDVHSIPWSKEKGLCAHQQHVRVILTLSAIVATQQNGVRILLSLKVIPGILSSLAYCHSHLTLSTSHLAWDIIQETLCSCLNLFCVVYSYLPFNPSFLRDANALMELFRRHGGIGYFWYIFDDKGNDNNDQMKFENQGKLIKWLCNLIHCLKVVKVNYVHAIKCLKRRHRSCEYSLFYHHHHDIFGAPFDYIVPLSEEKTLIQHRLEDTSLCQMAKWSYLLLDCLRKADSKGTRLLVLCALRQEGVCCCLRPASIVNTIVPLISDMSHAVRNYALETLNTMLLGHFQGSTEDRSSDSDKLACSQCSPECRILSDPAVCMDSGFASCELADTQEQKWLLQWRSLRLLRQHVLSGEESIALSVAKHLITLAVRGNSSIREELFFGIYLHVLNMKAVEQPDGSFRGERECLTSSGEEGDWMNTVPNSVMLFCVSSLPYVLQVDKVMKLFLEKGGLKCLTQLLDNDHLRVPVMGVFEALIMIDEQAMVAVRTGSDSSNAQSSVEYRGGKVIQTFIDTLAQKTCAITASFQQLQLKGPLSKQTESDDSQTAKLPVDQSVKTGSNDAGSKGLTEQKSVDQIHSCILNTLPALQDMWKTCAKLCMNSQTFRAFYRNSPCLYIVQETLVLGLSILSDLTPISPLTPTPNASVDSELHEQQDVGLTKPSALECHFSKLAFIEAVMVVCFSCQTILPLQKEGQEEEMWLRVRTTLQKCVGLEPSKLRAVFDMLLNAAQPQFPSILEYSYAQITSSLSQQDVEDIDEEDELKKIVLHWTDDELHTLYTEQGYEADTETNLVDDWHKEIEGSGGRRGPKQTTVQCFPAVLRLFMELVVAGQETASGQTVIIPVLLRLLHMLRCSHATARAACKQGLLELMLKGFRKVLLLPPDQQPNLVLYEILLTTVQALGQVEVSSAELRQLFSFFLETKDMDPLLTTLTGIVENSLVSPSSYLVFPANSSGIQFYKDFSVMHDSSSAKGVWSMSAVQCAAKDLQWPPFERGFSLSIWFSLDAWFATHPSQPCKAGVRTDPEGAGFVPSLQDCLHLASLGDSTKMFEVWLHVSSATMLLRLTSQKSSSVVLKEAAFGVTLPCIKWHHMVFSYMDVLDGSTSLGKLTVRLNGSLHREMLLDHPASMWHCPVSSATPSLHLGHVARHGDRQRLGQYSMGPVSLFSDSSLSAEWWFHVYALGPTFGGLCKCDCSFPRISYAGLLHKDILRNCSLNSDVLAGTVPLPDLEKALLSQLVQFDPENWKTYCVLSGGGERGGGESVLGLVPPSSPGDALLRQCPLLVGSSVSGEVRRERRTSLPTALEQLGGVQAVLFLVAKVFERNGEEGREREARMVQIQNKAVYLLFTLLHRFPPLTVTFAQMQGYEMLATVLRSSKSIVNGSLVKVLFDAAVSESVFKVDGVSGQLSLRSSSEALICDVAVITQVLLCWQIWQQADSDLMEHILSALVLLVRKDHPHHDFNVKQMQASGLVKVLFHMYLERIQEDVCAPSSGCGRHVAAVVSSVVGRPPDLALLATVTDFLLQLQPPTTRFISYRPAAFYLHPLWLSDEDQAINLVKWASSMSHEFNRGDKTTKVHGSQAADKGGEMEYVQFKTLDDESSETQWDSSEGSETSDVKRTDTTVTSLPPLYPPLEATAHIPSRGFYVQNSSGSPKESSSPVDSSSGCVKEAVCSPELQGSAEPGMSAQTDSQLGQTAADVQSHESEDSERVEKGVKVCKNSVANRSEQETHSDGMQAERRKKKPVGDHCSPAQMKAAGEKESKQAGKLTGNGHVPGGAVQQADRQTGTSSPSAATHTWSDSGIPEAEKGLETICLCLLQYLHKVVMEQPQQMMDEVFCQVVNPRTLLVLAQNASSDIRIAVTEVVGAYLWRVPGEIAEEFLRGDGLFLLANQLSAFPVGQRQVEAALSLLLHHAFTFNHHYVVGELGEIGDMQQVAPVLVMSSLCRILPDTSLCHNTLNVIKQVIENTPVMSKILIDLGFPDTLCNLLFTAQCHHSSATDLEGVDSVQLVLLDVQNIFCLLAVNQFRWSGVVYYQQMEYLFTILQAMEDKEKSRGELSQKRAETARALQFAMVVRVMDAVQQLSLPGVHISQGTRSSVPMLRFLDQHLSDMEDSQMSEGAGSMASTGYSRGSDSEEGKQSLLRRIFGQKKKVQYRHISQSELLERFKKFLVLAVDLAVFQDRREKVKPQTQHTLNFLGESTTASLDDRFLKHMFTTVYQMLTPTLKKQSFYKRSPTNVMLSAKDLLRNQLSRLTLCMLSSHMEFDQRLFTVSYLMGETAGRDVVRLLAGNQHVCGELGLHLHDLLLVWRDWMNPSQRDLALSFLTLLRQCGCSVLPPDRSLSPEHTQAVHEDKRAVEVRLKRDEQVWRTKRSTYQERVRVKFVELVERVRQQALGLTQQLAAQQGRERGQLVEHIKHTMAQQVQLKKNWQDIVHSLTHRRGVWHDADSYPMSFELDPTEGPGRIRRRMMRCHSGLKARYVRPSHQQRLACQEKAPPLKYLFEDDHQIADSATLVYKLFTNDTVQHTFVCTAVSPASESKGELLLGEQYLYFVADKAIVDTDYTQMLLGNKDQLSLMWRYSELTEVHSRWYQLQDIALEMFVVTGRTHLLAFTSIRDRDTVVGLLLSQLDRPRGPEQTAFHAQRVWLEGSMTNFDYLTFLNKLAGRSFNDLMQYPVFPFVLRDYDSEELDLENAASFRDLRKPIAVQDKSREKKYMDNYEFLRQEIVKPGPEEVMRVEPFHYGSHYSNSGTVLHYLVRLLPFTRMFLTYQDHNFDIPDRTFHSVRTSWRLSSFDSSTDVKELIPEFFFLPEFLINSEGFEFGNRQNGEQVNDVVLPAWCRGNTRLFVLIHRQALESAVVTRTLHHWLDLVFGYKQTGEEAVKAINVFHPSTYFGMDVSSVSDPVKRQALLTMIRTYGQTPRQLFFNPHHANDNMHGPLAAGRQQAEKKTYIPRPVATVNGLRWGQYVGSPDLPHPVWQRVIQLPNAVTSMMPLLTGPVFGTEANASLVTLHTKSAGGYLKQTDVLWAGVVTWEHPDNTVRVMSHNNKPLINFIPPNPYDKVTCCAAALDRNLLFVAGASGTISAYNMTHNIAKPSTLHVWGLRRTLCGHQASVTVLVVCKAFGIVVSGSSDATAIIWDLNRLSYVLTVSHHRSAVEAVAVSSTLGDVATVSHTDGRSELKVHTINGGQVGEYDCETVITCLAYSTAPEGRAINVIAGGLSTGGVRLWSSWDVTHLRDLSDDVAIMRPILSVAYTSNSQALFVSLSDGTIVMWHNDQPSSAANAALFMPVLQLSSSQRV